MRTFTFLHNCVDKLADGTTPYQNRFGTPFKGPILPFGCEILYKPSSAKVQNQMHPFGSKMLHGIFIGYYLEDGGRWHNGDLMVADWEDIGQAERASEIPIRRLHHKEVKLPIAIKYKNQPSKLQQFRANIAQGCGQDSLPSAPMWVARQLIWIC